MLNLISKFTLLTKTISEIGDFGLSREGHENDECQVISKAFGTKPYLPQEFLMKNIFSSKVDVFSYGVVLLELATAMKSLDKERSEPYLYDYIRTFQFDNIDEVLTVMDKSVQFDRGCVVFCNFLIEMGKKCTSHNPNDRPDMANILDKFDKYDSKP